jgi:aspartyl-tRNA(Asn)/glutamyl-tRNA(Gln) amidotransferase subunit B
MRIMGNSAMKTEKRGHELNDSGYEVIMGLEIHIQSKTKSKMFCSCDAAYFGHPANTHTCPVCLGLPGAMPVPNRAAIDNCVLLSLALNCDINKYSKFDRKNYFYPDLPKGFQISQYDLPFGKDGYVDITVDGEKVKIGITRVHQEEDTGKSVHANGESRLDYNKSGMPLIEAVSEPDLRSADQVRAFAKKLKQIVEYTNVSDANMEMGQMRFELNISLRKVGEEGLPNYKVEVKNIGSISVLEKVVLSEIERQTEILENGEVPVQETRGLVDMSGLTTSQRKKESEADYRYFPEPDIPPITHTDEQIEVLRAQLPELPDVKYDRYTQEYGIGHEVADTLTLTREKAEFFESMLEGISDNSVINEIAKWYTGGFAMYENDDEVDSTKVTAAHIVDLAKLVAEKKITGKTAKEVVVLVVETGDMPTDIVKEKGWEVVSDTGAIEKVVDDVIANNAKIVEDIQKNPNAVMALVGQVMKEMKGQADAQVVRSLLEERTK